MTRKGKQKTKLEAQWAVPVPLTFHSVLRKLDTFGQAASDIKKKNKIMENDIKVLNKSAEKYADKADNTGKFTIIAKSNSMKSAKDKQKTLETIKKELQDNMKENCKPQFK